MLATLTYVHCCQIKVRTAYLYTNVTDTVNVYKKKTCDDFGHLSGFKNVSISFTKAFHVSK